MGKSKERTPVAFSENMKQRASQFQAQQAAFQEYASGVMEGLGLTGEYLANFQTMMFEPRETKEE